MKQDIFDARSSAEQIAVLDLDGPTMAALNKRGRAYLMAKGLVPQGIDEGYAKAINAQAGLPLVSLQRNAAARIVASPATLVRYLAALQVQREREHAANLAGDVKAFEDLEEARKAASALWHQWLRESKAAQAVKRL
jgi:hypothetical protein